MQAAEMIFLSRVLGIEAFGHLGVTQSRATTSPHRKVFWACNGGPKYTLERLYPQAGGLHIYFSYFIFD